MTLRGAGAATRLVSGTGGAERDHVFVYLRDGAALEDCRRAAVVVSRSAIGRCGAALVIDSAQLREGGSRLVWRERTGWRVLAARRFGPSRRWQTKAEMSYD